MSPFLTDEVSPELSPSQGKTYSPGACGTVLENLIVIKLLRLRSTGAGACVTQILQEPELEPALLKTKMTGRVSN